MSEQDNIRIVQDGYAAFGRGDLDALLASFDPDIDWTTPGAGELPFAGRRRGKASVAAFFQQLTGMLEFADFTPVDFLAKGDIVVVIGRSREGLKGKEPVPFDWVHLFEIHNGLVTRFQEYGDVTAHVAQFRQAGVSVGA
jgi:ketosteroid isomerase-like protein